MVSVFFLFWGTLIFLKNIFPIATLTVRELIFLLQAMSNVFSWPRGIAFTSHYLTVPPILKKIANVFFCWNMLGSPDIACGSLTLFCPDSQDWIILLLRARFGLTFQKWFVSVLYKNNHKTDLKCCPPWLRKNENLSV